MNPWKLVIKQFNELKADWSNLALHVKLAFWKKIEISFVLQQVRELSRKQFFLRALIQKCREKAGLPPMAWMRINLLSGVDDTIAEQIKEWPVCVRFHQTPSCDCYWRQFQRRTPFWFLYTARFCLWMFATKKELFYLCSSELRFCREFLHNFTCVSGKLNGKTWL